MSRHMLAIFEFVESVSSLHEAKQHLALAGRSYFLNALSYLVALVLLQQN